MFDAVLSAALSAIVVPNSSAYFKFACLAQANPTLSRFRGTVFKYVQANVFLSINQV